MAERSGFFPYVSGDSNSEYDSAWLAKCIASFIGNGTYDGELAVTADGSAMSVTLPAGRAWINGYHYRNDGDMTLAIDNADGVLNRKDIVVLRWDINNRSITAQVVKGTPASTAAAPAITRTVEQYDLKLAEISIPAGTTAITQSLITDTRLDNSVCGIVTGVVKQADTTALYNQIQADLASFKNNNEAGFTSWANGLKKILDENAAGHLQNEIDEGVIHTYTHTKTGTVHALTGSGSNGKFLATADYVFGDTFTVNGTAVPPASQDGDTLPDTFFTSGNWVNFTFDGSKLNFKLAGGGAVKLNLFVQPDEPPVKEGLWIHAPAKETLKRVVNKASFVIGGEWQDTGLKIGSSYVDDTYYYIYKNGFIYYLHFGATSGSIWYYLYRYNITTHATELKDLGTETCETDVQSRGALFWFVDDNTIHFEACTTSSRTAYTISFSDSLSNATVSKSTCAISLLNGLSSIFGMGSNDESNAYVFETSQSTTSTAILHIISKSTNTEMQKTITWPTDDGFYSEIIGYVVNDVVYFVKTSKESRLYLYNISTGALSYKDMPYPAWIRTSNRVAFYQNELYMPSYDSTNKVGRLVIYNIVTDTFRTVDFTLPITNITDFPINLILLPDSQRIFGFFCSEYEAYYYSFESETLSENTLAVLDGTKHSIKLISSTAMNFLRTVFNDAWWYDTDFKEYPTYIGNGTSFTKIKN